MKDQNLETTLAALREAWDRRARENARHYVATGQRDWTDEDFYRSGECTAEGFILSDMENICQGRDPRAMRVLEIGCGAGRVTRALAHVFGEVHAVDLSAEMVRLAQEAVANCPNAHVYQNNGMDLSVVRAAEFDFAFSTIVFQHIPSRGIIESYLREVHRLLRPGALFKLEVLGGAPPKSGALRRLASACLHTVLRGRRWQPPPVDRTWFGWMVSSEDARRLAEQTGYELRYEDGADKQNYWLWLFKR